MINQEQRLCAFGATLTTKTYEIYYECKDCREKWTGTKEETKFD
jgi:hypothetical protein